MTTTVWTFVVDLTATTRRALERRRAVATLARADGAILRDLGISRDGIESAVRHGRRDVVSRI